MAYYPRKGGLESFKIAKENKDCKCLVCLETITKGQKRYVHKTSNLCVDCADCWEKEGGRLGNISRSKNEWKSKF